MMKKQYRTPKVSVGIVKKSIAEITSRWLRRNVSQRLPRSGLLGIRCSHRDTVGSEILKPSFSNSLWMRGAPQVGFSAAIRKISSRISLPTGLRPPTRVVLERHFQYSRKPTRCHATTVRGVTRISGFCQSDHSFLRRAQNNLCRADSRRRGRLECKASNCWRRAGSQGRDPCVSRMHSQSSR